MMSRSNIKSTEKVKWGGRKGKRGEGRFIVMAFVFPSNSYTKVLNARKKLNICLLMGSTKLIPLFALFVCTRFAFFIKLSLS